MHTSAYLSILVDALASLCIPEDTCAYSYLLINSYRYSCILKHNRRYLCILVHMCQTDCGSTDPQVAMWASSVDSVPPVRLINIAVEGQIENALTSQLGHPINIYSQIRFDVVDQILI